MLEGEATFYSTEKYNLVNSTFLDLTQFLLKDDSCSFLLTCLQKAPTVMKDLQRLHNIIQLTLLQLKFDETRYFCVANTHLYFHPAADHIRLIQVIICTKAINKIIEEFKQSFTPDHSSKNLDVAVVFCGDFNSCPCIGAYSFLTNGSVEKSHFDWTKYKMAFIPRCGCSVVPEEAGDCIPSLQLRKLLCGEEGDTLSDEPLVKSILGGSCVVDEFSGVNISHSLSLQDAYGSLVVIPYTNFTLSFKCVLDYIFIDTNYLAVEKIVPLPSLVELTENVALPSITFPSDHISLICDLKWKKTKRTV